MRLKNIITLLTLMCLLLTNCTERPDEKGTEPPPAQIVRESDYMAVQQAFTRLEYHLAHLNDQGVPPVVVEKIPDNLADISETEQRKRIFFKIMLPLILMVNEEILDERKQLAALQHHFKTRGELDPEQYQQLKRLAARYRLEVDDNELTSLLHLLSRRIDIIPVDLALAQAANESGWGGSRFTREANNLFGQWTFVPGRGVVPENRPEGETYEVKSFPTIYDSVRSYANNLNTHHAYREFRQMRATLRQKGKDPDGLTLAQGLLNYSTRGEEYVAEIQSMILFNNLEELAQAQLR